MQTAEGAGRQRQPIFQDPVFGIHLGVANVSPDYPRLEFAHVDSAADLSVAANKPKAVDGLVLNPLGIFCYRDECPWQHSHHHRGGEWDARLSSVDHDRR